MKRLQYICLLFALLFLSPNVWANGEGIPKSAPAEPIDTTRIYNIEEAVVVASPKETSFLKRQPISATLLGKEEIATLGATSLKQLSMAAPNFYMPAYGSRVTSATYVRGVGSRIGEPAVGLYVDNVPYGSRSAYDFSFLDVARIDVLRGPQGTLYGSGAMGGVVRLFTVSPFDGQGTDVEVGGKSHLMGRSVKAVTYLHPHDQVALSLAGTYEGQQGAFKNSFTGKDADESNNVGGKARLAWRPSKNVRVDAMVSYEYSDENACPYYFVDTLSTPAAEKEGMGEITQNRQSQYRRSLWNTSLGVEWIAPKFVLTQIAAYQYLNDRLFMDQDFIAKDIFSLTQKQRVGNFTEELSLRSRGQRFWEWTAGAFFRYQHTQTDCPVVFHGDGMRFLNDQFAAVLPKNPPMTLAFTNDELHFVSDIKTPMWSGALFHQSTLNFGAGISAVAGLRLAYDHHSLDLKSGLASPATYQFAMPAFGIRTNLSASPETCGTLKKDTWQVLPKLALQYKHKSGRGNVYLSAAKGYRPGGYNLQSYSDLAQVSLRRDMMLGVKEYSINTINAMPLPDATKQGAIAGMSKVLDANIPAEPNIADLEYKAEEAWNYELGGHLNFNLGQGSLNVDYSAFYVTTKNRQLARFAESGMGRITVNAGRSRSIGAEVALRAEPLLNRLILQATYGYTHATLVEHNLGEHDGVKVDYSGNRVPFAPEHTFSATATYRQPLTSKVLRSVYATLGVNGAGRIYWDEANTYEQPFYAQMQARLGVEFPADVKLEIIGHNLTNTRFTTFAFDSMERRFAQYGNPRHFEVKLNWHF